MWKTLRRNQATLAFGFFQITLGGILIYFTFPFQALGTTLDVFTLEQALVIGGLIAVYYGYFKIALRAFLKSWE